MEADKDKVRIKASTEAFEAAYGKSLLGLCDAREETKTK